jgi:hypothetical protein
VGHHDVHLTGYHALMESFLQQNMFGVGELGTKHIKAIMSVLGMLLSWMSTMSSLGTSLKNYQFLAANHGLGNMNVYAKSFLQVLEGLHFVITPHQYGTQLFKTDHPLDPQEQHR